MVVHWLCINWRTWMKVKRVRSAWNQIKTNRKTVIIANCCQWPLNIKYFFYMILLAVDCCCCCFCGFCPINEWMKKKRKTHMENGICVNVDIRCCHVSINFHDCVPTLIDKSSSSNLFDLTVKQQWQQNSRDAFLWCSNFF